MKLKNLIVGIILCIFFNGLIAYANETHITINSNWIRYSLYILWFFVGISIGKTIKNHNTKPYNEDLDTELDKIIQVLGEE